MAASISSARSEWLRGYIRFVRLEGDRRQRHGLRVDRLTADHHDLGVTRDLIGGPNDVFERLSSVSDKIYTLFYVLRDDGSFNFPSIDIAIRSKNTLDGAIVSANEHDPIVRTFGDNFSNRTKLDAAPLFSFIIVTKKHHN